SLDAFRWRRSRAGADLPAAPPTRRPRHTTIVDLDEIDFDQACLANRLSRSHSGPRKPREYAALMSSDIAFWQLQHLSNQQLLDSLGQVLHHQRRSLAELAALLGALEKRRLQLEAPYGSRFDYCVRQLHMSEDEACRRIDLARLA